MQQGGCNREITVQKEVICTSCNGSREKAGSTSSTCYSCQGEGVKEDSLFHKKTRCNTCKGQGKLVNNACPDCKGKGLQLKPEKIRISIDRFIQDGQTINLDQRGHQTLYPEKGLNGSLFVIVRVREEIDRWRSGNDVHTRHYMSLSDALEGCLIQVPTVHGAKEVKIQRQVKHPIINIPDKGITSEYESQKGDHIVTVYTQIPRDIDGEMR